jgi:hypothetical protein
MYRRPGGPQGRSGRMRGTPPPRVFHPRTVQPAASRYTVYAMKARTVSDTAANTSVNLIFVLYCWLIHVSVTEPKNVYCATGMFDIQTRQARSRNHYCRGITYFLCVCVRPYPAAWACAYAFARVTLLSSTQCACAILHCYLWPLWLHRVLSTLSHKRHDFLKSYWTWTTFISNTTSHSKNNSAIYFHKCRNFFV